MQFCRPQIGLPSSTGAIPLTLQQNYGHPWISIGKYRTQWWMFQSYVSLLGLVRLRHQEPSLKPGKRLSRWSSPWAQEKKTHTHTIYGDIYIYVYIYINIYIYIHTHSYTYTYVYTYGFVAKTSNYTESAMQTGEMMISHRGTRVFTGR